MNEKLFTGLAENYSKGRPAYARQLIAFLATELGINESTAIADIGAGTGIFSRQLAGLGCRVICVEPNADMLAAAKLTLSGFSNVSFSTGTAEATGLAEGSVDTVTAAQAFHWFDVDAFKAESRRILRPGGNAALIWNSWDGEAPIIHKQTQLFQKHCPRFKGFSGGITRDDERIARYFGGSYSCRAFENPLVFTRQLFLNRCLSSSYSLKPGDSGFEAYVCDIHKFFDRFSSNGALTLPNRSIVYFGKV